MKTIVVSMIAAAGLLSAGIAQADQALAGSKGCMACHAVDKKLVGPAFKDIAKKYTAKDTDALVKSVLEGSTGKWKEVNGAAMPANKAMGVSADDAKKLVAWVLSQK